MKKFITTIALQSAENLKLVNYEVQGNSKLVEGAKEATYFPIIPVLKGYVEEGEEIGVVAIVFDDPSCESNYSAFEKCVNQIVEQKNLRLKGGVTRVNISMNQEVDIQVENFKKIIDVLEDNDELYACITYGTKAHTLTFKLALQYADRIKYNTYISCVVYGQIIDRVKSTGRIYDETALFKLDEIVRVLADQRTENPEELMKKILSVE
ncbi:MAG: TM1812 family CRISPR-associated protein [Eubacteriales bacterium]